MTRAAGKIRVPMIRAEAWAVLVWLHEPIPQGTAFAAFADAVRQRLGDRIRDLPTLPRLLGDDDVARTAAERELGALLAHERTHAELSRGVVQYLANLSPAAGIETHEYMRRRELGEAPPVTLAPIALRATEACHRALRRAGRPRRTSTETEAAIERELLKSCGGDERLLRRLRKEMRRHDWVDRLHERGETLMTSTEPHPS